MMPMATLTANSVSGVTETTCLSELTSVMARIEKAAGKFCMALAASSKYLLSAPPVTSIRTESTPAGTVSVTWPLTVTAEPIMLPSRRFTVTLALST